MIWDSRDFKNFKPSVRDFFKLQRHYKVVCFLASQTWDIDKKLRDLTDKMYLITNFMTVFSLVRPVNRRIVLTEASAESESRISENLKFSFITDWRLVYIPKYHKYYDSFIVPDMPKLPFKENVKSDVSDLEVFTDDYVPLHAKFGEDSIPVQKRYLPLHTKGRITLRAIKNTYFSSNWFIRLLQNSLLVKWIDSALTYFALAFNDEPCDDDEAKLIVHEFSFYLAILVLIISTLLLFLAIKIY